MMSSMGMIVLEVRGIVRHRYAVLESDGCVE